MGMPISSYTVLTALTEGEDRVARDIARGVLAPFRQFAFVIHDPLAHPEFGRALERNFEHLDVLTGEALLFFALVDPGRVRRRAPERQDRSSASWTLMCGDSAPQTADPGVTAFALASSLGIPAEALPCVVTTRDFASSDYAWASVDADTLAQCLVSLGAAATRRGPFAPHADGLVWNFVETPQSFAPPSLAARLATPLAFATAPDRHQDEWVARNARQYARVALEELAEQLYDLKDSMQPLARTATVGSVPGYHCDEFWIRLNALEELAQRVLAYLSVPAAASAAIRRRGQSLAARLAGVLERRSFRLLQIGEYVADWFDSGEMAQWLDLAEDETVDWAPSIVNFAKVFECEIDLSVVHWARARIGVELPRYFNKVQPGTFPPVQPAVENPRPIDLNAERKGAWLPPPLGDAALACTTLATAGPPPPWDEASWLRLMNRWHRIQRIRNASLHTGEARAEDSRAIRTCLAELANEGDFARFHELKSRYRGAAGTNGCRESASLKVTGENRER